MRRVLLFALVAGLATAQSFEVATIHPSDATVAEQVDALRDGTWGLHIQGNQVNLNLVTLFTLVGLAYEVDSKQIVGRERLISQFFNIQALMPVGTTEKQVPAMLRELLTERFKLVATKSEVVQTVYVLQVSKDGHKMLPTPAGVPVDVKQKYETTPNDGTHVEDQRMTMSKLASLLGLMMNVVVLDQTGLPGSYSLVLDLPEAVYSDVGEADPGGDYAATVQKLGLRLQKMKVPIPTVVIERAERMPIDN